MNIDYIINITPIFTFLNNKETISILTVLEMYPDYIIFLLSFTFIIFFISGNLNNRENKIENK